MKMILFIATLLILLCGVILVFNRYYIRRRLTKSVALKYASVEPLVKWLADGGEPDGEAILKLATNPSTRIAIFRLLEAYKRAALFPSQFYSREKSAESFMVEWLEFPTELGSPPVEIDLLEVVILTTPVGPSEYYVFQFRTETPSQSSDEPWMMGVCGPYQEQSIPFDTPLRIYSRFRRVSSVSAEQEAYWVHTHIKP